MTSQSLSYILLAICFCTAPHIFASNVDESEWKAGILKDISTNESSRVIGTMNAGQGVLVQARHDSTFYTIESGDYVYVAKRTLTRHNDKQLELIVNGPVKFAIHKLDFYILDERGERHKLTLEKKILRAQSQRQ